MQLFFLTAALFAGLGLAQDLSALNGLPQCGVRPQFMPSFVANAID
jgi:hypothetical protein